MNQKTLIGLAVAAVLAIVAAVVLNHSNRPQSDTIESSVPLLHALRYHVNDVSKLVVTGAGNKVVATLERGKDGWTLAEKGGYGADTGKLRAFLLKLADAKKLEQKTANKDRYALLGVEDVAANDAKGLQVELDGLAQPIRLVVGNADARGGTYVRLVGDAQSWLASGALTLEKTAPDWLRKDLTDLAATRIASVSIVRADGGKATVSKKAEGDANFVLADVPKGREAGSEYTINGLASTLAGLRFDDVLPASDAPVPESGALKARYTTFDGLVVEAIAWVKDGKDYAQFTATLDGDAAGRHVDAAQAKEKADYEASAAAAEAAKKDAKADAPAVDAPAKPASMSDAAKDREARLAAANKEVVDLNAKFAGWTFVLPAYKYANMDKSTADLLKPLDDAKAADAAKPAKKKG
jgi:hypothetical protein